MRSFLLLYSWISICLLNRVYAFQPGVRYTYQFDSRVVLSELQPSQVQHQNDPKHSAQVTLKANLSLTHLKFANGLSGLRLQFLTAFASNGLGVAAPQSLLPPQDEFLLTALESNSPAWITSIAVPEGEDPFWINLARGFASLLRYRDPDRPSVESREADAMGECGVSLVWLDGAQTKARRIEKRLTDCENVELSGERNSASPLFNVRRSGGATSVFEFSSDLLAPPTSVHAREAHELLPDVPSGFGLRVSAESHLELQPPDTGESDTQPDKLEFETLSAYMQAADRPRREVALPTALEVERFDTTGSLVQFLTRMPSYLRDSNPSMHALAIVQGLPMARGAKDQAELRRQLELEANRAQLPNIMELYAACGTKNCLGALFDFVAKSLNDLSDNLLERLLLTLAQSSRVSRPLLERMQDLLQRLEAADRWSIARSAYQTVATLGRKFAMSGGFPESNVPDLLLNRLAGCETARDPVDAGDCQMAVLSAMANCPSQKFRQPLMRGLLVNASVGSQLTVARIRALQASGPLDAAERRHLAGLLQQRHVPLSDPIRFAIANALGGPAACTDASIDCSSLRRSADLWLPLRRRFQQPAIGHEEVLAGLTSSGFQKGRLLPMQDGAGGVEFELDMLGNRLGTIRLSEFRLTLVPPPSGQTDGASGDILGVRLYADAIDSLLDSSSGASGGGGSSSDLTEEATAGMQLNVLGEWLRPRRFFTGTSGLMSAVWNAPEEPVNVLEGGLLLQDFASRVHLHNGLVVQTSVTGALSLNVSGSLSVSIWNRNAVSKVLNSMGLALYAQARLRTGRFSVDFVSQAQAELQNTFATFVEFSNTPVSTCLVMSNSPLAVTRNCHVTDSLGPRYDHHSHDAFVPGRSYSLGGHNDRLCSELVPASDDE